MQDSRWVLFGPELELKVQRVEACSTPLLRGRVHTVMSERSITGRVEGSEAEYSVLQKPLHRGMDRGRSGRTTSKDTSGAAETLNVSENFRSLHISALTPVFGS